ncbi:hypothetical protein [Allopontixanthobacter sp.]|uniref:hypothetical protein n=1 Tax=Allopontixanthobacter sp. TaxID=2906452 RepID=UPI002AB808C3|nr:hypothetical protein [Allopontixanthobacter sp.]MDZ4308587.1 hypothetical protein [Allopontixanthobacter sp.]
MIDRPASTADEAPVEALLREALEQGDAVLDTVAPVLAHLLTNNDDTLFSDAIVARVRGIMLHLAWQLLIAQGESAGTADPDAFAREHRDELAASFAEHSPLLTHCHALAVEWDLAVRLDQHSAIDPILSPLLQALVSSDDEGTAASAMTVLTSQARFIQHQRRMELPVHELPGELFHQVLAMWRNHMQDAAAAEAERQLRVAFDESSGRLGLLSRMVTGMGSGAIAALSIRHAGPALFLSALALASDQDRDLAALSTNDGQMARLALALRAAGMEPKAVEEQFFHLHPAVILPDVFGLLRSDRAAAILAARYRGPAG